MRGDRELLKRYCEDDEQDAFGMIVSRYVDLVYSVAMRQLGASPHLARDVCQEVFMKLARKADKLGGEVAVSGWLYQCAHYTARNAKRGEQRRKAREEIAVMEQQNAADDTVDWEPIRPLLDEAICRLSEDDRTAICLRFFESKSYAEIGERLNTSEDASRMRVNRALEKLRAALASKGVRSTGAALGSAIAAQAALSAPVGLAAAITQSVATGLAAGSGASAIASFISFMNTTKATATIAIALTALTAGVAVYQTQKLHAAQAELALLESQGRNLSDDDTRLSDLRARLATLDTQIGALRKAEEDKAALLAFDEEDFEEELESWSERTARVTRYLDLNDKYSIPELEVLTTEDWLKAINRAPLETEADFRKVLSTLRYRAKSIYFERIATALRAYVDESDGAFPADLNELIAYSDKSIDPRTLSRYSIVAANDPAFSTVTKGKQAVVETVLVDPIWDSQMYAFAKGTGNRYLTSHFELDHVAQASEAFKLANHREPSSAEEIVPYIDQIDIDPALVSEIFDALIRRPNLPDDSVSKID